MPTSPVSRTTEDYVTLIWKAHEWPGSEPTTSDLAASLGVTPPTVSANLKKLARDGFITYEPYGPIALTDAGRSIAVDIVRRHRIIETYLVQRLGLSWDEVHEEADLLEHAVSERVLARMDEELGHPTADPHGDPIPSPDGEVQRVRAWSLADVPAGEAVRVVRVSDRQPQILRYLAAKHIDIGTELRIAERSPAAGSLQLDVGGHTVEMSTTAALAVRVVAQDAS